MSEPVELSGGEPLHGYQLRVVQEVLLALLAGEAAHGYQLRARLALALGPLAGALNEGQVYVTLGRLEKSGLVSSQRIGQVDRPDRKVYALTPAGRERVLAWLRGHELVQARPSGVSSEAGRRRGDGIGPPSADRGRAAARAVVGVARGAACRAGRAGGIGGGTAA